MSSTSKNRSDDVRSLKAYVAALRRENSQRRHDNAALQAALAAANAVIQSLQHGGPDHG